jgi:hypothetical protein
MEQITELGELEASFNLPSTFVPGFERMGKVCEEKKQVLI